MCWKVEYFILFSAISTEENGVLLKIILDLVTVLALTSKHHKNLLMNRGPILHATLQHNHNHNVYIAYESEEEVSKHWKNDEENSIFK